MEGLNIEAMLTRADLERLDRDDPLAPFRDRFALPSGVVYLDGNSLGPLPRATPGRIAEVVTREWGDGLIRSWNDAGWIDLAARVADGIARLVGAAPGSVAVADSTSVNLFKLLGAALTLRPGRRVIVSERDNFPTDLYVAQGLAAFLGGQHVVRLVEPGATLDAINGNTAVVMLSHVNYRTGAMHDMAAVTLAAQEQGALILWDLAHSAGAVPVDLAAADADFAVGCGYKFLNGGPGAPAFLYVAPRLHATLRLPITGWLGHAKPFAFETEYRPALGLAQAIVGTPPILSLAALEVGVGLALEAPLSDVRDKSLRQVALLAAMIEQAAPGLFRRVTPGDPARHGSQLCLSHPDAYAVMQALIDRGVIGDFRTPDILRFGITPLTLSYAELWDAAAALGAIMAEGAWCDSRFAVRRTVT
jgi:kynureninase